MRLILFPAFLCLALSAHALAALTATSLRCEYVHNPLGVDVAKPHISWVVATNERGSVQTAYQVLVATSVEALSKDSADLWDSGVIRSDQTLNVEYAGKPLTSWQQVFWKVRAWDEINEPSKWSEIATFTTGLLSASDWPAQWIGASDDLKAPTLALRREFEVKPGLVRAVVAVCGLGQYEMSINGAKVGTDLLTPGWTKYDKTCLYDVYDVTSMLSAGANATGILLGNGMYNVLPGRYTKFTGSFGPQKATAMIRLTYADGSTQSIITDGDWRVAAGPITFSSVYGGEDYDARLEQQGWNRTGFDDSKWLAVAVTQGPGGTLKGISCQAPPIREIESLKPVAIKSIDAVRPNTSVYDLGQNTSLMLRMNVHGPAGSIVRVTPAELVNDDGSINRSSVGNRPAYWQYTLRGGGADTGSAAETYFSKFFYHGSRYFQVERIAASDGGELPVVDQLEGVVVHSSATPVGSFSCSNDLFNRTHTLVRWAQRSNMVSVLTDCPHRERLGWIEQDYLNGPSLRYEFDLAQFYTKLINDMSDSQRANGLIPDIAPEYTVFAGGFLDSPEWGSAFIQCAWQQYEWTGDAALLSRYYDGMKRYVDYLTGKSNQHIVDHGLGDWYDIGPRKPGKAQLTPISLTATAIYYSDIKILEQTARLLKKADDAERYASLGRDVRDAFNRKHFNRETGTYATNSQTANAMAVALGLCDDDKIQHVVDAIVADVRAKGLTSGDVGYRYLLRALAMGGRSDVIFEMNNQSDKPGYGYMLKKGATALTEAWDAARGSSQNHFMLGHIVEWFYADLAGIQADPSGPGFKKIIIKPAVVGDLTSVKASYDSVRGRIVSEWTRQGDHFTLHVSIPANTTARVYLPARNPAAVTEGDTLAVQTRHVRFIGSLRSVAEFEIGSGDYNFACTR